MFTSASTSASFFIATLAGLSVMGVSAIPARRQAQAGQVITTCSVPNTAAITFDDGPYLWTHDIVDMLESHGAKATFFVNGNNYGCIYDSLQTDDLHYAYSKGHQIGSHTWGHKDLATLSAEEVESEFTGVDVALQRILGITPAMMRPPFGSYNDVVTSVAAKHGQVVVNWDFDSGDSAGVPADQSNGMYDGLVGSHPSSILALNHETYDSTAHIVLEHAINALQGAGYKLVTVAECIGAQAYSNVGAPGTPDASWTC